MILQGVHQLMSYHVGASWPPGEPRSSRLVFIGLDLPQPLMPNSIASAPNTLLDIRTPGRSGLEAARSCASRFKQM